MDTPNKDLIRTYADGLASLVLDMIEDAAADVEADLMFQSPEEDADAATGDDLSAMMTQSEISYALLLDLRQVLNERIAAIESPQTWEKLREKNPRQLVLL